MEQFFAIQTKVDGSIGKVSTQNHSTQKWNSEKIAMQIRKCLTQTFKLFLKMFQRGRIFDSIFDTF